ncbi:MAG: hypothetical protein LUD81_01575, partial [Clostridiales bacterium]|nr:hypothetical protein [Clostridiales bacterium]
MMGSFKKLYLIFYCLAVIFIAFIFFGAFFFGELNIVIFVYGKRYIYLSALFFVLSMTIPYFMRKSGNVVFFALLTLCLAAGYSLPGFFAERAREACRTFSYELWTDYPVVRSVMYKELENSGGSAYIIGKSADETVLTLGEPDLRSEEMLIYNTSPGYINIYIENGITESVI